MTQTQKKQNNEEPVNPPGDPSAKSGRRVTVRLSQSVDEALQEIRRNYGGISEAEALRRAISHELRISEAFRKRERFWLTDDDLENRRELVFFGF